MNNLFVSFINAQFSTDEFTNFLNKYNNKDYEVKFDGMWKHYHIKTKKLPQSGWKGHIAAQPEDKECIFDIAFKILTCEKCEFKVARSNKVYQALANPHAPVTEANKFITFYPESNEKFRKITKKLFDSLKKFCAPEIFTDYQLSHNSPVQFRYGAFKEFKRWDANKNKYIQLMKLPSGKIIEDDREKMFYIPEGVKLPFKEIDREWVEDTEISESEDYDRYSFEKILSQKNKGDVYLGTLESNKVILKSANPFVKNKSNYKSAKQLLENELKYLNNLKGTNIVPQLIDTFTIENEKFEVVSYVDGISLDSPIAKEKEEKIISSLCKTVYEFHSRDLVISDLTNNNFIYNSNGNCYLIDLEYVRNKNDLSPREGYTPYYVPYNKQHSIPTQKEDLFSLAVTILGILFKTVPRYEASSLESAVKKLKKQILIQEQLDISEKRFLDIAACLLDISVSTEEYNPEILLNIQDMVKSRKNISLYSRQNIRVFLKNQKEKWKKDLLGSKFKNGLREKDWDTSDFSEITSKISIQNGVLGVTRALGTIPWKKIKDLEEIINSNKSFAHSESYLFGSSGIIWEVIYEYKSGLITYSMLEKAIKIVINSWNDNDEEIDFALGISGKLYTLIFALLSESKLTFFNNYALKLQKRLKHTLSNDVNVFNLKAAGFAHGLSGEVYVLLISSIYFMDDSGIKAAIAQLEYIDEMLLNRIQLNPRYVSYMDLSWCEGISGIAMALLRSQYILKDKVRFDSLSFVSDYLLKNYSVLESNLCHGKESIIAYFNDVAIRYQSIKVNQDINLLVNFELSTGEINDTKVFNFFDETGYTHIFDYGTGQTGILETCLRAIKDEDRLFYLSARQEKYLGEKLKKLNFNDK